ncbi:MAG: hypothetical protein JW940_16125, partial [Polyangiaceae bacterium]|nr:hypothetical protein [Polyangiaceae bacterium]
DPDQVEVGMAVEMVTRRVREDGPDGVVVYGYKFRPPVPRVDPSSQPTRDLGAASMSSRPPGGLPMS